MNLYHYFRKAARFGHNPGALKAALEQELGGVAVFMQGAAGDLSTDRGEHGDYRQYGAALGREAARLAASLATMPVTNPRRYRQTLDCN